MATQPYRNFSKSEDESLFSCITRQFFFRLSLFSFMSHNAKQQIPPAIYNAIYICFLLQLYYVCDYSVGHPSFLNSVSSNFSAVLYLLAISKLIWVDRMVAVMQLYCAFTVAYFIFFGCSVVAVIKTSRKKDPSSKGWMTSGWNLSITVLSFLTYVHFHILIPVTVRSLVVFFRNKNSFLAELQANDSILLLVFQLCCYFSAVAHVFQFVNDYFIQIVQMRENLTGVRLQNKVQATIFFLRIYLVVKTELGIEGDILKYLAVAETLILAGTLLFELNNLSFLDFNLCQLNFFFSFLVFQHQLFKTMNMFTGFSAGPLVALPIWCTMIVFLRSLIETAVLSKIERILSDVRKLELENKLPVHLALQLFNQLEFLFVNQDKIQMINPLINALITHHEQICKNPSCCCQQRKQRTKRQTFRWIMEFYYDHYEHFFSDSSDPDHIFQRTEYLFRRQKKVFEVFSIIYNLSEGSYSLATNVRCLATFMDISQSLKKNDAEDCSRTLLETRRAPKMFMNIRNLKENMIKLADSYKEFLEELMLEQPSQHKLRMLLKDMVQEFKEVYRLFHKIDSKYPDSYKNLFTYYLFLVNLLNEEEESNKIFNRLIRVKRILYEVKIRAAQIQYQFSDNAMNMLVIVSGNNSDLMKIRQVFDNYKEFFGLERSDLINQNVRILMPETIGHIHNHLVENFYRTGKGCVLNRCRVLPATNKERLMVPIEMLVRAMPDLRRGVEFIGWITTNLVQLKIKSEFPELFDSGKVGFMLFDKNAEIVAISKEILNNKSFSRTFVEAVVSSNMYEKYHLHQLFPALKEDVQLWEKLKRGEQINCVYGLEDTKRKTVTTSKSLAKLSTNEHLIRQIMDSKLEFILKLAFWDSFGDGRIQIGMLSLYQKTNTRMTNLPPISSSDNKYLANHQTVQKQAPNKPELKNAKQTHLVDFKELKEMRTLFARKSWPNSDFHLLISYLAILVISLGVFLITIGSENTLIFDFFNNYSKAISTFSDQSFNFNKMMQLTIGMSLYKQTSGKNNSAAFELDPSMQFSELRLIADNLYMNSSSFKNLTYNYPLSSYDASKDFPLMSNTTAFYPLNSTMDSELHRYQEPLLSIHDKLVMTGSLLAKSSIWTMPSDSPVADESSSTTTDLSYFLRLFWANTIYAFNFHSFGIYSIQKTVIDDLMRNYNFFKTALFAGEFLLILVMFGVLLGVTLYRSRATDGLIFLFSKIDEEHIRELIMNCETFGETIEFLSKYSVNNMEVSKDLLSSTGQMKKMMDDANNTARETAREEIDNSKFQKEDSERQPFKKSVLNDSSQPMKQSAKLDYKTSSSQLKDFKMRSLNVPSRRTLASKITTSKTTVQTFEKSIVVVMLFILFLLLLVAANYVLYVVYSRSFEYILNAVNSFVYYKTAKLSLCSSLYAALMTNSSFVDSAALNKFKNETISQALTVFQIFEANKPGLIPSSIRSAWMVLNTDTCAFLDQYKVAVSKNHCLNAELKKILSNGIETTFTYLISQLDYLLAQYPNGLGDGFGSPVPSTSKSGVSGSNSSFTSASKEAQTGTGFATATFFAATETIRSLLTFLGEVTIGAMDLVDDDRRTVFTTVWNVFVVLAFVHFGFAAIYLIIGFPLFYFYLKAQRTQFEKIFVFMSLRTIAANPQLLKVFEELRNKAK